MADNHKPQTPAHSQDGKNANACPAAALADEAQQLIVIKLAMDQTVELPERVISENDVVRIEAQAVDFIEGVCKKTTFVRATSARGALYQLCVANHLCEDDPEIGRLLDSVADFIEELTGERRENACSDYFMSRRNNAHQIVAQGHKFVSDMASRQSSVAE